MTPIKYLTLTIICSILSLCFGKTLAGYSLAIVSIVLSFKGLMEVNKELQ